MSYSFSSRLTDRGYVKREANEIKQDLIAHLQQYEPSFEEQPADVQNMLLDTSIVGIMQYENLMAEMINSYTPAFANKFMWLQMASSLGLRPLQAYKSQVTLVFTGNKGDFIPKGLKVSGFELQENLVIGSTGTAHTVALSDIDEIQPANTLTHIQSVMSEHITVTNPNPSYKYIEEETFEEFKSRVQSIMKSARVASDEYAYARIKGLEGVDRRLVAFRRVETELVDPNDADKVYYRQGIECIVGGGDQVEVSKTLFESFLETQCLVSYPSDGDQNRTISEDINFYSSSVNIKYTLPKLLELRLELKLRLEGATISSLSLSTYTEEALTTLINTKRVGEPLSHYELQNTLFKCLEANHLTSTVITQVEFVPYIDGTRQTWNANNQLDVVKHDCYLTLTGYSVSIL